MSLRIEMVRQFENERVHTASLRNMESVEYTAGAFVTVGPDHREYAFPWHTIIKVIVSKEKEI